MTRPLVYFDFRCLTILVCLVLGHAPAWAGGAVELSPTGGAVAYGQIVVAPQHFQPLTWLHGAFFNPTGALSPAGDKLYLYVQGDLYGYDNLVDSNETCKGDKTLLFTAPVSNGGLTSQFTFVKRVSPCNQFHYGLGGVFKSPGFGYVLALDRPLGNSDNIFHEIVYAESPDGMTWPTTAWPRLVNSTGSSSILDVTMTASPGATICDPTCFYHETWWGVFRFGACESCSASVGRIKVDRSAKYPRGLRVWILSGGIWQKVDDETGNFNFSPDNVWSGAAPNAILKRPNGTYEVWATAENVVGGCGCNWGGNTQFVYRTITPTGLGPLQYVYSYIRCMPSNFSLGRMFPFRLDVNGRAFLYSTTQDANCQAVLNCCEQGSLFCTEPCDEKLFSSWQGMYLVVTEVGYNP